MKNNLEILMNEHQNILIVANAISKKCNQMKEEWKIDVEFVKKSIDFIQNYADKFHHLKEEDLLFKNAEECLTHCNPIWQMLHEHNVGREYIKWVIEWLNENNLNLVNYNLLEYVDLIDSHIYKEDNILYPMLDEEMWEDLDSHLTEEYNTIALNFDVNSYLDFAKECSAIVNA